MDRQIITQTALQSSFFLILHLLASTECICQGPYLNLCGYYENELNNTEESAESICDCQQARFCYIVDLSQECDSTIVILDTDGNTTLSSLNCELLPLESGVATPAYELLNQTENGIIMNILTDFSIGRYRVSCFDSEILEEFNTTTITEWDIRSVDPTEVTIDTDVELHLTVNKQAENPSSVWCFVRTPDNTTEVFSTLWISDTQISCIGFKPTIPGVFHVSLHSVMTSNLFDKNITVRVVSKHPIAEKAEYSVGFETISIYFDDNIELHSNCANVFTEEAVESFGGGFDCYTKGNVIVVRMGLGFQIVDNVSITSENYICRAGCRLEYCLFAASANLILLKPKVLGPTLSLYMNPICGTTSQKYINVNVTPAKYSNEITQNQTLKSQTPGKTHRKNLIMWRTMRKIQSKFSSPLIIPQTNTTEVFSLLENLSSLDDLDVEQNSMGSASVSVFVRPSPRSSTIVAEASVNFCEESKLYRYKWIVNREEVFEDGKVLIVEDLAPGKYVIKCLIVGFYTNEVFGQGWATTEIIPQTQKVLIIPSEITAATTDNITLRAITAASVSWQCKTSLGELCTTTDQKSPSDVLDLTSPNIFITAGMFPVGDYIWSLDSAHEANTAKVYIKPGNRTGVDVELPAVVEPSEEVVLRGSVKRAEGDCRAWWSSAREKGFSYLNFDSAREKEEIALQESDEIDLVIPPPSDNNRGLESDSIYLFKLQVFCPRSANNPNGSLDYIKFPLRVHNLPRISPIVIEPLQGFAMVTNFMVSGGEADGSESLIYEWSYVDSCDEEISIRRGAFARNFTTFLPPGDIKLKLKVCSEREVCTATSTPEIGVVQESEFPAENFDNARNQIKLLLSSGDTFEGFGLAITIFKSLSLIHEPEIREKMFLTVGEYIKAKIKDLTMRMESNSKVAKLSVGFCEQALTVAKYFRKDSDILNQLIEFKDKIMRVMNSEKRRRRL